MIYLIDLKIVAKNIQAFISVRLILDESVDIKFFTLRIRNKRLQRIILRVFEPGPPNILDRFGHLVTSLQRELGIEVLLVQADDDIFAECSLLLRVVDDHLVVAWRQE